MELEKRKVNLIKWITQIENEQLIGSLEELKKDLESEALPAEIIELLVLSNESKNEQLIRYTTTKEVFDNKPR